MTPKQILDSFSQTLMQDERILGAQERELLAALLNHARGVPAHKPEIQQAVRTVIASAVGETVAQRAFAVLGSSIVEQIVAGGPSAANEATDAQHTEANFGTEKEQLQKTLASTLYTPDPPSPGQPGPPRAPAPPMPTRPTHPKPPHPVPRPLRDTPAPAPVQPGPPRASFDRNVVAERPLAVLERPSVLKARCVVLDEFLAPQELDELTRFALEHEEDFSTSEVISPRAEGGVVDYEHRRSRVLTDVGQHKPLIVERIKSVLPQILQELGMEKFLVAEVEVQATASNEGDFFRFHCDNGSDSVASRSLTFVYFFHREPRQFEGGELRIHDAHWEGDKYVSDGSYRTIVPRQNQIVFFPCELLHEITPVRCASRLFADSRFTLNGWLHR